MFKYRSSIAKGLKPKRCAFCREAFRHFGVRNANGEYVDTGKKYLSYAKMCVDGPCDPGEGVNRSMVDKTVPKLNETVLPVVSGTILTESEKDMLERRGWKIDTGDIMFLQQLSADKVKYEGEVRGRGAAPRNDGLPDTENETQRFARMREEREKRGREREIEREMRVVEKELTERPRVRPDVEQERKFRQVGRVTQAMRTRLEEAIDMNTEVHVMHFEEGKVLRVRLLERRCAWAGEGRDSAHTVVIDQAPRCDSLCDEYEKNLKEGTKGSWLHCKHVYAVLYVGLGVRRNSGGKENVPLIHQATFSRVEVREILSKQLEVSRMGGEYENWDE
jgi:hypothetical protein